MRMKLQTVQIERLVRNVIDRLKEKDLVTFKKPEKEVFARAIELVTNDFEREDDLVKEVHRA